MMNTFESLFTSLIIHARRPAREIYRRVAPRALAVVVLLLPRGPSERVREGLGVAGDLPDEARGGVSCPPRAASRSVYLTRPQPDQLRAIPVYRSVS